MIICSRCKTDNDDSVKFCRECGNDLVINVDAPANEDLKTLADTLNQQMVHTEKQPFNLNKAICDIPKKIGRGIKEAGSFFVGMFKKIGKKKLIIISCFLVAIIAFSILTVNYVVPFAPHYFNGNSALKSGDYITAISEYELAGNFFNTKSKLNDANYLYAEELYGKEKFYDAATYYNIVVNYEDTDNKIIQCGTKLIEDKKYKKSLEVFEMVNTDEVVPLKNYALGKNNLNNGYYEEAKKNFNAADGYSDSETMINACDLMMAENHCKEGDFSEALKIYNELPVDFEYNGIYVEKRLDLINSSQTLLNSMGRWEASKNYIETRETDSTGGSRAWYIDELQSDQELYVYCKLNDDNTFTVKGSLSFKCLQDYIIVDEDTKPYTEDFSFEIENMTSEPASYDIGNNTTLTYSNGIFSIKYYRKYTSYYDVSSRTTEVTYGKRVEE